LENAIYALSPVIGSWWDILALLADNLFNCIRIEHRIKAPPTALAPLLGTRLNINGFVAA
jgi:hypothetical protein